MSKKFASWVLAGLALLAQSASAGWIDWTSSTTGTLDVGGTSVGVSLTGSPYGYVDGDYYYNNAWTGFTNPAGTYDGLAPNDFIQVYQGGGFTLTFDQSVNDLYMSLISVGQPNLSVTYDFNNPFTVEATGTNYWGYGGYSLLGDDFTGNEFNGILKFSGAFTSISFNILQAEYWHGFNFASFERSASVPEPGSLILFGLGLIGLSLARKRAA